MWLPNFCTHSALFTTQNGPPAHWIMDVCAMECLHGLGGAEHEWAFNFLHCLLVEHAEKLQKRCWAMAS